MEEESGAVAKCAAEKVKVARGADAHQGAGSSCMSMAERLPGRPWAAAAIMRRSGPRGARRHSEVGGRTL